MNIICSWLECSEIYSDLSCYSSLCFTVTNQVNKNKIDASDDVFMNYYKQV